MSTKNSLPFSNQFERGHSFNWAGEWKSGTYYFNDEYVTDFIVLDGVILACRKNHEASTKPAFYYSEGRVVGIDSPYWEFVMAPMMENNTSIIDSEYIANATQDDVDADSSVILRKPYIKLMFSSGSFMYIPIEDIITQYKVGVPILTQAMYDELPDVTKPEDYILIPDETDLTETNAGNYLEIMFGAIRSLQAEVAKLKNSFEYGIQSYTGTDTTMSEVVSEYEREEDDEPLWSVDEEMLSGLEDVNVDFKSIEFPPFYPQENISYSANGYATINNYVGWTAPQTAYAASVNDTKIFLYLTLTNLDVNVHLTDMYGAGTLDLNIANATNIYSVNEDKYNVCLLISRQVEIDEDVDGQYGTPYIWISVGSFLSNVTFAEGYYNPNNRTLERFRYELDNSYTIDSVTLPASKIYKFKGYTKWQDFSKSVIPSKPTDTNYKFKAAHITIRSVDNMTVLEALEDQLLENELIYVESNNQLWIKSETGLHRIGGGSSHDDDPIDTGMTEQEMLDKLVELGIVYVDGEGLQLSNVSDITFINQDTNKKFKFAVDSNGELKSTALPARTLQDRVKALYNTNFNIKETSDIRGFIAKLHASEAGIDPTSNSDLKLNSDRLKIGAVYCPLTTDTKFGCTHGYIELENTSDKDIPLDNVYLHYLHPDSLNNLVVEHLELDGQIYAGSTYVIRCKQYADKNTDADVFISVDDFDKEWYVDGQGGRELLDLKNDGTSTYGFALTFGNNDDLTWDSEAKTWTGSVPITANTYFVAFDRQDEKLQSIFSYKWYFIDSLMLNANLIVATNQYWGIGAQTVLSNCIIKTTFELDPAKQAYQALTKKDSSRWRLENVATDIQQLQLDKEFLEFPLSDEVYPVSRFTPKSSKQRKNVSTDKSKLDMEKPNMVTCSFGINTATTRTFNWISCGQFDEYVWLKDGNSWIGYQSYKRGDGGSEQSGSFPRRKVYSATANDAIYARITKKFPGDLTVYTSHKCVIDVVSTPVLSKTEYTYIVGRAKKDGTPDFDHCSEEYTFTLYPSSFQPRIYQITDQQGFHWIEYQVWAAAAKKLDTTIRSAAESENIIPVLINTGDMTQNGTRINEWLDYYNAGKPLFQHLEQVNCVGNNDLCNTDPEALGTGDDNGKSNGFYFHVFYCYDVDENNLPIIVGDDNVARYIPSLYYLDFTSNRIIVINSEITYVNCNKWFNKHYDGTANGQVVNLYTGWAVPPDTNTASSGYCNNFTTIYTMIYNMLNTAGNKHCITACHEMPFTVVTVGNLQNNKKNEYRSLNGTSLVGSHMNQMNANDTKSVHWFSRLLEYFGVKLCIGGHKHTYACTFPLCEYYLYDNGTKNSKDNGPMTMGSTLQYDDSVSWVSEGINLSKFPLADNSTVTPYGVETDGIATENGHFSPITLVSGLSSNAMYKPVVYFMCQATGYKLKSNKELPSNYQHFSRIIPQTGTKNNTWIPTIKEDKPDGAQQRPMFAVISITGNNYSIELVRIENILNSSNGFTQQSNSQGDPVYKYAVDASTSRYCTWSTTEQPLITI